MKNYIQLEDGTQLELSKDTVDMFKKKLEKTELPTSWEEICKSGRGGYYVSTRSDVADNAMRIKDDSDKNTCSTKETAEAVLALTQLMTYRDIWNDGWKPDWTNDEWKPCIVLKSNGLYRDLFVNSSHILTFKSEELRDKFYNAPHFKSLMETAKELL